ncbi:MAG: tetratricopeptide repeat protein, partial [Microcoleaceae cyanobacterium]
EQMTRQPATVQWSFLNNLANIDLLLSDLPSNIVIWLTRPWLRTIEQSAPEFWQKHTGIFEFEGEPTPLPPFHAPLPPRPSAIKTKTDQVEKNQDNITHPAIARLANLVLTDINQASRFAHNQKELNNNLRPLQLLQSIQKFSQNNADHPALAIACYQLGKFYRELIFNQQPPEESHLKIAIQSYQLAINLISKCLPEQKWDRNSHKIVSQVTHHKLSLMKIWQDLGTFHWILSKLPNQNTIQQSANDTYIKSAIKFYRYCLTQSEISEETKAEIYKNLGGIYHELGQSRDEPKYLLLAIKVYKKALIYAENIGDDASYIATCNNLGTIYWHLAKYTQPCVNLQLAINAYNQAIQYAPLPVKTKENIASQNPTEGQLLYAMLTNNLGTAYLHLYQYQPERRWLFQAVKFYEIALEHRPPQQYPLPSAATYNNLGTAYWYLAEPSDGNNLWQDTDSPHQTIMFWEQAIMAYTQAIHLTEPISSQSNLGKISFDLLATKRQLGLAHYQIANLLPTGDRPDQLQRKRINQHLQRALHYQIEVYKKLHPNHQITNNQTPNQITYVTNDTRVVDIDDPDFSQIVKTIRSYYEKLGITGQNQALSKVPSYLLPAIFTLIS